MKHEQGTRERLLQATIEVIDAEGVKGVRIRDIASAAGVREPSVYHFFGSREGLVEAALAERFNIHNSDMVNAFGSQLVDCRTQEDFVQLIHRVLEIGFNDNRAKIRSLRADVIGSAQSRPKLLAAINEAAHKSYVDQCKYIESAQIRGWIDPDLDSVTFAAWAAGMFNNRLYIEMNPGAYNTEAFAKMTISSFLLQLGYVDGKQIWKS